MRMRSKPSVWNADGPSSYAGIRTGPSTGWSLKNELVSTAKSASERRYFYSQATHILFAIVLGQSFLLAPPIMIPITTAFAPENQTAAMALGFSYVVIVAGWIGYARSVSRHPHKDTGWGVMRFALNIVILYEYFYLLRISQTEHVADLPWVMMVLFGTYVVSDMVKTREYGSRYRKRFRRRTGITWRAFFGSIIVALISWIVAMDVVTIGLFTALVLGFSASKWHPMTRSQRRPTSRDKPK